MDKTNSYELQNEKCFSCKFCVWDEERKCETYSIKGCFKNSVYKRFEVKPDE